MADKVIKHTLLFSAFILLAQVFGLVRDIFLLRFYGVGQVLDTYYLAFKIPDFMQIFYSVFLGTVIFVPLLTKILHTYGEDELQKKINQLGSLVLILVSGFAVLLFLAMPYLAPLVAPAFDKEQLYHMVNLSRILILAQFFFPVGVLAGSLCMIYDRPFYSAVSGFVYNLIILIGAVLLSPFYGIYGVVYSVVTAAFMYMAIQIYPNVARSKVFNFRFEVAKDVWAEFVKKNYGRFVSVFLSQFFWLSLLFLSGFAGAGGVTIFYNAFNIFLAIFYVLGGSFSTVLLAKQAKLHESGNEVELKKSLINSLSYMFVFSAILAIYLNIFSEFIVRIIYHFSSLREADFQTMGLIFAILAFSVPVLNIIEVIKKYFYARGLIKENIYVLGIFIPFLFIFYYLFSGSGVYLLYALALAVFFSNFLTIVFLFYLLSKKQHLEFWVFFKNTYKSLALLIISVFLFKKILVLMQQYLNFGEIFNLLALVVLTSVFVFAYTYILKDKILKDIIKNTFSILRGKMS